MQIKKLENKIRKNDLLEILSSGRKQFYKNKVMELYSLRWKHNIHTDVVVDNYEDLKAQIDELKSKYGCNKKYRNYFVTITSTKDKDKNQFILEIKKLFKIAVISEGYLVFEQRGETQEEVGKGLHAHMLLFRNEEKYNHSKFKKRFLEKLIKLKINKNYTSIKQLDYYCKQPQAIFSFQNIKNETVKNKLKYIKGNKENAKLTKVCYDKIFRNKYKLDDIYKK